MTTWRKLKRFLLLSLEVKKSHVSETFSYTGTDANGQY